MSDLAHDLPDDDPNYDPTDQSSSQEYFEMGQGTLRPILKGYSPCKCLKCKETLLTDDLTVCPICGTSSVMRTAIVHYAKPCLEKDHDRRFPPSISNNELSSKAFTIPCQPNATEQTPRPSHLCPVLDFVTCPACLRAMGVQIDEYGRITV